MSRGDNSFGGSVRAGLGVTLVLIVSVLACGCQSRWGTPPDRKAASELPPAPVDEYRKAWCAPDGQSPFAHWTAALAGARASGPYLELDFVFMGPADEDPKPMSWQLESAHWRVHDWLTRKDSTGGTRRLPKSITDGEYAPYTIIDPADPKVDLLGNVGTQRVWLQTLRWRFARPLEREWTLVFDANAMEGAMVSPWEHRPHVLEGEVVVRRPALQESTSPESGGAAAKAADFNELLQIDPAF